MKEIVVEPPQALAVPTPMHLIELAVQKGADADQLGKLMELQLKWQANEARLAYVSAIEQFKANPPEIKKTKKVQYKDVVYWHAELDDVTEIIGAALGKVGLTHSFRTGDVGGRITVTCSLTHKLGHSEDISTLGGPPDTTGSKNSVQAIGSTVTYLQRYTLLAGLGLTAENIDNDGATGEVMDMQAVEDYGASIRDAGTLEEAKSAFTVAYRVATDLKDQKAMKTFAALWEEKKRQFNKGANRV